MGYIWRIVLVAVIIWLLYRLIYNWFKKPEKTADEGQASIAKDESLQEMVQDPVCKVYLPRQQAIELKLARGSHFFCSEECREKFKNNTN